MRRYTKDDVEFHSDGYGYSRRQPAINVKCYSFPVADKIAAHYGKDEDDKDVERVMQWLWDSEVESFWEMAQMDAEEIFGSHVKVHSQGRSGGWLVVNGLKDFEDWDAIDLSKWRKFERWMKGAIPRDNADWLSSFIDTIDANEWLLTADDEAEKERETFLNKVTALA